MPLEEGWLAKRVAIAEEQIEDYNLFMSGWYKRRIGELERENSLLREALGEIRDSARATCKGVCEGWEKYQRHSPNCPYDLAEIAEDALKEGT